MEDEKKIIVVDDKDEAERKALALIGKVKLLAGRILDRANAGFSLHPHEKNPSVLTAIDGTVYVKDKSGTMRRVSLKKHQARAMRRLQESSDKTTNADRKP